MTTRTIKEVFRDENGIEPAAFPLFTGDIATNFPIYPTWMREDSNFLNRLDGNFFKVKFRDRVVSPFVEVVAGMRPQSRTIIPGYYQELPLHQAISIYADKWDKIHSALLIEYNPLENYSMEEKETPNITKTGSTNNSANSAANVYGFNSASAVPQGSSSGSGTGATTETETGTRDLTRSGNIGVTTSQQMLEAELEVRKNILVNIMCDDIASVLCSPVWRVEV